ncbi:MAG: GH36-type glycosyl hydrolase domain-containing protein [Armatimonadota bacterium]
MKLTDIDLHGYGRFLEDPAAFRCDRYNLPARWDYVYTNGQALLRVCHDGGGFLQLAPPGGPALFRQERGQLSPSFLVWLIAGEGTERCAFTNFWRPTVPLLSPAAEPGEYSCTYTPEAARYQVRHAGWTVDTELLLPPELPALIMTVTVRNDVDVRQLRLLPALKPHLAPFSLAPWDIPEAYQTAACAQVAGQAACWFEARDPGGEPARRLCAALLTDLQPTTCEVSAERFLGRGEWHAPGALWGDSLAIAGNLPPYGTVTPANAVLGQSAVGAFARDMALAPGESFTFSLVFGALPPTDDGSLPPVESIECLAAYLQPEARAAALAELQERSAQLFAHRRLTTPDEALSRYAEEWLPLQLQWVNALDRGWPTGMRGTRDAAQDATGIVPLDPALARARLREIFALQRADGWFLRQYSTAGPAGSHDARAYVDAGCWVWELLWEYLCYTRDFSLLDEEVGWLDDANHALISEHARRLFAYYLAPENLGEHGLCNIREGDWNDALNRAGLEGRGESVMVTCQLVLALEQAAELFDWEGDMYRTAALRLRGNLLAHARNDRGYFNGVFTDAGQWVFSPHDPDGRVRVNGPANSFAVIAGIVTGEEREPVLAALQSLKGPHGWRLFSPPIGDPPIEMLGRLGHGDLAPGLYENGAPYNHGSHGFLARAAWTAGRGDLLYEVLRYTFSYDQAAHPVEVAKAAPYAVVNQWKEAMGLEGAGGATFLSGTISTAMRNMYQGLAGFRPGLHTLTIDPCLPRDWDGLIAEVPFLGGRYTLTVHNPDHVACGVNEMTVNGAPAPVVADPILGRRIGAIPIDEMVAGKDYRIEVSLLGMRERL